MYFWDRFLFAILKTEENFVVFAFEHEMRRVKEKTQNKKKNEKKLSVKVLYVCKNNKRT